MEQRTIMILGTMAALLAGCAGLVEGLQDDIDASPSSLSLQRFHQVLQTNSRRYFGSDEDAFRSAVDWHHARLRGTNIGAEGGGGGGGGGGAGTFAVFTSHGRAARAREVLSSVLSSSSVRTAAHNREQGGCFLVHSSAADVNRLSLHMDDDETPGGGVGAGEAGAEAGGDSGRLFDGFVAVPPTLKLAPSLLDHGGMFAHGFADGGAFTARVPGFVDDFPRDDDDDGPVRSGEDDGGPAKISPGKALRRNSGVEGLVVLLLSPETIDGELAMAERWRRDWSSPSLDLHGLSFWSDSGGHRAYRQARRRSGGKGAHEEEEEDETYADVLAREWGGAASTAHALAERLGGVSPAEACGWNDIKVAPESSGRITLRNIGHLLPGRNPAAAAGGGAGGGAGSIDSEAEKTACLLGLISFLASRPEVARVSALPRAELLNAVAGRAVQGASATSAPIWGRGVDGSGEVVQVLDSGVAQGSCFFRNSATTLGPDHGYLRDADGTLGAGDFQFDLSQRKVVQYIEGTRGVDVDDDPDGHGSHVAGSVAGSIYSGWDGPAACPDGVAGATADQTAVSCVGRCLAPSVLEEYASDNTFDLDTLCPDYECDVFWEDICLSNDRSETLEDAQGVAPGAKLAILDLGSSDKLDQVMGGPMWEVAAGTGARLHSASWGFADDACTVNEATISFDEWAFENPEHLLIFAAGNKGDDISGCSIVSPAVSKNSLAVGSSMSGHTRLSTGDLDEVSEFSSKGPTADGRIKPDVLAPGHFIFSAANGGDGSCELDRNSGTSMSCPIAAGAAALVRQYIVGGFYADDLNARGGLCAAANPAWACGDFSPSGALVKALLLHGADPMGGSTDPDGDRGFGRIHLESALPFDGEGVWALYVEDADGSTTSAGLIAASGEEDRSFVVSEEDAAAAVAGGSSSGPGGIRVTLVWMDPPATAASAVQLVHDLDLFLEGPDGTLWTMSGQCSGDQASCSLDNRNNVERIVVPASDVTAGTWTARVSAANGLVEGGPQSYALAVSIPISTGGAAAPPPGTPAPETVATVNPSSPPAGGATPTAAPVGGGPSPHPSTGDATAAPEEPVTADSDDAASSAPPTPAATAAATAPSTIEPSTAAPGVGSTPQPSTTLAPEGDAVGDTPAPVLVIAAPGTGDGGSPTPAPDVVIAAPGGETDESRDSSSVVVGGDDDRTSSPSSVGDDDDDGGGARGIGETPSPASGVGGSGASAASRAAGGRVGGVLWGVVAAAAAAVLSTAAAAEGRSGSFVVSG